MKHAIIGAALLLSLGLGCQPDAEEAAPRLTLTNPSDQERSSAPVVISLAELTEQGMSTASLWAPHLDGQVIPYQYDDLDADGAADELVFMLALPAKGEKAVTFKPLEAQPDFAPQTHLRLGKKSEAGISPVTEAKRLNTHIHEETEANFQFEGVGWENEQVGFRNYMDLRNGMDIFGKTSERLYLDSVGLDGDDSYHELADWGMDILKVGNSLGAGSVAFWYQDSLIRLSSAEGDYRALCEGPVRSTFELTFRGVNLGDKTIDVTHTISIYSGSYAYQGHVSLSDPAGIQTVVGLVDLYDLPAQTLESEGSLALYTYGQQSENKDLLGLALLVEQALSPSVVATDSLNGNIPDTYALVMQPEGAEYRFYSGWERSAAPFTQETGFAAYLQQEMAFMDAPLSWSWRP